jgi:alcohol dehydrogenase
MLAARLHEFGGSMKLEQVPIPEPGRGDVLIKVKACGVVPNFNNVLAKWKSWFPYDPLPKLPASFGLDVAGIIEKGQDLVQNFRPGDRVYVDAFRRCGTCRACRSGHYLDCQNGAYQGYFGLGPGAPKLYEAYPNGGLAEYELAPAYALVKLPDKVTFEQAARFGYLGTAYGAYRKVNLGSGDTLLINGISGTLGLSACLIALAMGVPRILGTARNVERLAKVKALAPERISVLPLGSKKINDWARELTNGDGVDVFVDCNGAGAAPSTIMDGIYALRRGGKAVNIGGMGEPVPMDVHWMMDNGIDFFSSVWYYQEGAAEMAAMAQAGTLDLSVFKHKIFPLSQVNKLCDTMQDRDGGFTNFVVVPD